MKDNEGVGGGPGAESEDRKPDDEGAGPSLDPSIQTALGRELRAMYDEVVCEPVPDRFLKLLERLDASEKEQSVQRK